jgi:light-regulated signal transduction histidine kinase (bacteriophytochrome)
MYISATTSITPPAVTGIAAATESAADSSADDPATEPAKQNEPPSDAAALAPFMRTLGHELRNVMGTIGVSVEVLRSGAGGQEASRSALNILDRQTTRLEGVMSTALDLARAIEGQLGLSLCRTELGKLVAQVIAGLPGKLPAMSLHVDQPAWVDADPIYLAQAIKSLCMGTLSGSAAARIRVEILSDGDAWLLSFGAQDSNAPAATRRDARAAAPTGLTLDGLLAWQIVQLHHGSTHRPSLEQGGGFTLTLPRAGG